MTAAQRLGSEAGETLPASDSSSSARLLRYWFLSQTACLYENGFTFFFHESLIFVVHEMWAFRLRGIYRWADMSETMPMPVIRLYSLWQLLCERFCPVQACWRPIGSTLYLALYNRDIFRWVRIIRTEEDIPGESVQFSCLV